MPKEYCDQTRSLHGAQVESHNPLSYGISGFPEVDDMGEPSKFEEQGDG